MSVQTMESMVKWVDNNVMENPTLESMSSHAGYSQYYCSSKFREHVGITCECSFIPPVCCIVNDHATYLD